MHKNIILNVIISKKVDSIKNIALKIYIREKAKIKLESKYIVSIFKKSKLTSQRFPNIHLEITF